MVREALCEAVASGGAQNAARLLACRSARHVSHVGWGLISQGAAAAAVPLSADIGTSLRRFVAEVAELSQPELEARKPSITTKLVHKYIEPLEVQITAVPGGEQLHMQQTCLQLPASLATVIHATHLTVGLPATFCPCHCIDVTLICPAGTEAQPLMVMVVRRTSDTAPLMVTDQKGKIMHATSDLAKLLGYGKKQLCSMELTDLLPPPFAQLHKPWVQVSPCIILLCTYP
jgi:hypothetical protein